MKALRQLSLSLLLVACSDRVQTTAKLNEPIVLSPGQAQVIPSTSLTLEFLKVESDSRCPIDVSCVTGGQATVLLNLKHPGAESTRLSLGLPQPDRATWLGYQIRVLDLRPYPLSTQPIDPSDYQATLVLDPG